MQSRRDRIHAAPSPCRWTAHDVDTGQNHPERSTSSGSSAPASARFLFDTTGAKDESFVLRPPGIRTGAGPRGRAELRLRLELARARALGARGLEPTLLGRAVLPLQLPVDLPRAARRRGGGHRRLRAAAVVRPAAAGGAARAVVDRPRGAARRHPARAGADPLRDVQLDLGRLPRAAAGDQPPEHAPLRRRRHGHRDGREGLRPPHLAALRVRPRRGRPGRRRRRPAHVEHERADAHRRHRAVRCDRGPALRRRPARDGRPGGGRGAGGRRGRGRAGRHHEPLHAGAGREPARRPAVGPLVPDQPRRGLPGRELPADPAVLRPRRRARARSTGGARPTPAGGSSDWGRKPSATRWPAATARSSSAAAADATSSTRSRRASATSTSSSSTERSATPWTARCGGAERALQPPAGERWRRRRTVDARRATTSTTHPHRQRRHPVGGPPQAFALTETNLYTTRRSTSTSTTCGPAA